MYMGLGEEAVCLLLFLFRAKKSGRHRDVSLEMRVKLNIMGIYVHIHNIYFHNEKHIGSLRTKRKISE